MSLQYLETISGTRYDLIKETGHLIESSPVMLTYLLKSNSDLQCPNKNLNRYSKTSQGI